MEHKRRPFSAKLKARVVRAALQEDKTLAQMASEVLQKADFERIITEGGRSAAASALASVDRLHDVHSELDKQNPWEAIVRVG